MPLLESTSKMPRDDHGYGPSFDSTQSSASAVNARLSMYFCGVPTGTQTDSGTPLADSSSVILYLPNASVTRYDDVGLSRCQSLMLVSSSTWLPVSSPLATPTYGAV